MVTIGGVDLAEYGITPIQNGNGNIAFMGLFDMPARIGKTFHDWQDENGIEPYVRADEIRYGGRDIVLNALLVQEYENQALRKLEAFYIAIQGFTDLVDLVTDYGTYEVYLKDEIKGEYFPQGIVKLQLSFRQPIVPITGTIPATDNTTYGIDGISFQALGLTIMDVEGRHNLPAPKAQLFTAYATEGYQITKRNYRELILKCVLQDSSLNGFQTRIDSLLKLFSKEGLRTITYRSDALRTFFVKDGFQVSEVYELDGKVFGVVNIRCVQVGRELDWNFLTTHTGEPILTHTGAYIYLDSVQNNRDFNYLTNNNNQFLTTSNGLRIRANDL